MKMEQTHAVNGRTSVQFSVKNDEFIYARNEGYNEWFLYAMILRKTAKGYYIVDLFFNEFFVSNKRMPRVR